MKKEIKKKTKKMNDGVPRFVKTGTMKVRNDAKMTLFPLFSQYLAIGSGIKDKLYNLGQNEDTQAIYNNYISQSQRGHGAATTVFTELDEDRKYTGKKSFPRKYRGNEVFPMYAPTPENYDFTTAGYHYSINAEIHEQLDSHNECDKACVDGYNDIKNQVNKCREELDEEFGSKLVEEFFEFINEITLMGWRFDGAFQSFFKHAMLPALKEGKTLSRGTYKLDTGKTKRYGFFNEKIADKISKNKKYWSLLESSVAADWIKANNNLFYKKEHAQYTPTSLMKAQMRLYFGNNGVPFSVKTVGDYAYFSFRLPSIGGKRGEFIHVPCAFRKVYNGKARKSCYFGDLTIESGKPKGTYVCKYSVNHKRPQTGLLKECFLRLVVRNQRYFDKLVKGTLTKKDGELRPEYFDFYFDFALNITEEPIHNITSGEVLSKGGIRAYYSSAWPEIKNLGGQKTIKTKVSCPVKKPHNVMGIDLGQRNPFAYCIKDQNGKTLATGHLDGSTNDTFKSYIKFGQECSLVTRFIKSTRAYLYDVEETIEAELFNAVKQFVGFDLSRDEYLSYLNTKKKLVNKDDQKKTRIHQLRRRDQAWIGCDCLWYLSKQYAKLNAARMTDADWKQTLYWIDALYRLVDANKAFHNFGSYHIKATKQTINGTTTGFCSSYQAQINNNNEDMFKKFSFALLPIVKENHVCVVALEELDSMLGDANKISLENRNYNLWPVGQLKTFLESRLKPFNVALLEVDERNTSQVCNGEWCYREGDNLYYLEGRKLRTVHADENAANNIVDRALTKHTNLFSMYMVNPSGDYYVPISIWSPKEKGGARVRGFLTKWYKNSDVVFIKKDGKVSKSKMTVKELKKLAGKSKMERGSYWYRVNSTEWVDEQARDHMIDSVRDAVMRERVGDATPCRSRSQLATVVEIKTSENSKKDHSSVMVKI